MAEKAEAGIKRCTSCGRRIEAEERWVEFGCPACSKARIIRCDRCKSIMVPYECGKCGFTGP
jgi:predicted RNA-binding Zn-ribbon protein involved in translation (DUF1610 family)